jgi:hypothetical protein
MVTTLTSTPIETLATQTHRILRQALLFSASLITIVPTAIATPVTKPSMTAPLAAPPGTTIPNGTYLYGEAAKANQLGSAYLVFELRNSQLKGAVYWPGSAFECVSGQVQAVSPASPQKNRLVLTFLANQNQPATTRDIAITQSAIVASTGKTVPVVGLEGMQPIGPLTSNDQRILKTCQAQ